MHPASVVEALCAHAPCACARLDQTGVRASITIRTHRDKYFIMADAYAPLQDRDSSRKLSDSSALQTAHICLQFIGVRHNGCSSRLISHIQIYPVEQIWHIGEDRAKIGEIGRSKTEPPPLKCSALLIFGAETASCRLSDSTHCSRALL